jgi:hypothetical protein
MGSVFIAWPHAKGVAAINRRQAKKKLNNLCDLKKAGQCAWLSFFSIKGNYYFCKYEKI